MNKVTIIAEAGVNHCGDISIAKKLIDIAFESGVDYVKFQTFKSQNLVTNIAKKASYQISNSKNKTESQLEMLQKLELSEDSHYELINYSKEKGIKFFSTAFDLESLDLLYRLGFKLFKIPSGEITNLPYLKKVAKIAYEVIISTGMCELFEIEDALNVLLSNGIKRENITILHCNTEYPTPFEDVNLNAMVTLKNHFNTKIGYSDHTLGIEVPIAAVAMGATVIEKHFTLDRNIDGPDHAASLEPIELKQMVSSIRNIEKSLGSFNKKPSKSEINNIEIARKSIHLNKNMLKNQIITEDDLIMKRPGTGISPMKMDFVIGKKIIKNLKKDYLLKIDDLK